MRHTFRAVGACLLALATATLAAQDAAPGVAFEVASIRLNPSGDDGGGGRPRAGGGYTFTNMPLRSLIGFAFSMPSDRIVGAPAWIATERYNIDAVGKPGATMDETRQMTQALLRERFQLQAHVEQQELPIYSLVLARPDGRLGPGLRPAAIDCSNAEARKKAYDAAPAGARLVCGISFAPGLLTASGVTVSTILGELSSGSGRRVLDRTGLGGLYDVDLKWAITPQADDAVSIFTAVQEQLGLKLESATAPLEVLVVDRVERPSEN